MKINAKKTNSASEKAIQSSYFGLELEKLTYTQLYKWVAKILWFWPIISQNQGNRVPVGQLKSTHIVYSSEGDIEYACYAFGFV